MALDVSCLLTRTIQKTCVAASSLLFGPELREHLMQLIPLPFCLGMLLLFDREPSYQEWLNNYGLMEWRDGMFVLISLESCIVDDFMGERDTSICRHLSVKNGRCPFPRALRYD